MPFRALILFGFLFTELTVLADESDPPPAPPAHLLELGLGFGAGYSPDYPGAAQGRVHYVPFPIIYFHGKILRSDREDGARARVVNKPRFGIDVSGSGGFPIKSGDNRAREGMPDLEWLGEFGPRGYIRLLDRHGQFWRAFLAARAAFSTDLRKFRGRGFVLAPGMGFEHKKLWRPEISVFHKVSAEFATREYSEYFYSVDSASARPGRPQYDAVAGYLGTWFTNGLSFETKDFLLAAGVSLMFHDGSANRSSPLFRNEFNVGGFIGLAYFFYHSEKPGHL